MTFGLRIFRCLKSPFEDLEINTIGTLNVLNAAVKNGVRKIINASSACVYGQAERTPQDENHETNPNWAYGVSKLAAEKYCAIFSERFRLPIVSLRYGIVYGEREWMGRVLTMFLRNVVIRKMPPVIFGTGQQLRDFIYVKDAVALQNACLNKSVIKHEEYNVATGMGTSVAELARIVTRHSGLKAKPIFENVLEGEVSRYIPGRKRIPQELQKMVLSPRRAFIDFGWVPLVSLVDGVKREMDWITRNPSFWPRAGKVKV
jgi:UDP-glucose 4-epimerase